MRGFIFRGRLRQILFRFRYRLNFVFSFDSASIRIDPICGAAIKRDL